MHHSSATLHYIQCINAAFILTYPTFEEGKKEIFLHRKGNFLHRKGDFSAPKSGFFCTVKRAKKKRRVTFVKTTACFIKNDGSLL